MSKWKRPQTVDLSFLVQHPEALTALYKCFVDDNPVVGTAQFVCELQRLVDGGFPAGKQLQGYATRERKA